MLGFRTASVSQSTLRRKVVDIKEYRSILGRLPIKSPTAEEMALLCPHLTPDQAVEAFTKGDGYVACPPLYVSNAYNVLAHRSEWVEEIKEWHDGKLVVVGTKNHPARIDSAFARRTRASYVDPQMHYDYGYDTLHFTEAIQFAEDNWGAELVLDNWACVVEIFIQDPTELVNDRYHKDYPRTKAVMSVALSRDINSIINDRSKPQSELMDDAIIKMSIDVFAWSEMRGSRGGYTDFKCAHCGAGLSLTHCTGCGHQFRDDQFRCGSNTPMSRKMVAFMRESGYSFAIDPEIAITAELERRMSYLAPSES